MDLLSKEKIEQLFEEINDRLAKEGKHGEILLSGGAALTLVFHARNSTYDIDAIFEPKENMQEIIDEISEAHGLRSDWLNDGVKGFLTDTMTNSICRTYSNLTVSALDAEPLLAMKLTAARPRTKDFQDSIFLMNHLQIKTEDELFEIVSKYTHENRQTAQCYFFAKSAFDEYQKQNRQTHHKNKDS